MVIAYFFNLQFHAFNEKVNTNFISADEITVTPEKVPEEQMSDDVRELTIKFHKRKW